MNESLLHFPCHFPIKVIGKADLEFEGIAIAIIRQHVPNLGEGAIKFRYSKQKHYLSITANLMIDNQQQLNALYRALSAHPLILYVL